MVKYAYLCIVGLVFSARFVLGLCLTCTNVDEFLLLGRMVFVYQYECILKILLCWLKCRAGVELRIGARPFDGSQPLSHTTSWIASLRYFIPNMLPLCTARRWRACIRSDQSTSFGILHLINCARACNLKSRVRFVWGSGVPIPG